MIHPSRNEKKTTPRKEGRHLGSSKKKKKKKKKKGLTEVVISAGGVRPVRLSQSMSDSYWIQSSYQPLVE